jgi:putative transposase
MSRNAYFDLNVHVVWHRKNSAPLLNETIRARVYAYIERRLRETPNVKLHAIGGTATHVHIAAGISPAILIQDWVGQLKGASAHHINFDVCKRPTLQWQSGYGVVSYGSRHRDWIVAYVRDQERHHAAGTIHTRLEVSCGNDAQDGKAGEPA